MTDKSIAVDFIENRLPQYHPAFQDPPPFDPVANRFVSSRVRPNMQANTNRPDSRFFWASIFSDAMELFRDRSAESKTMQKSKFRIRDRTDWDGVQRRLQAAQDTYIRVTGFEGWVKWPRRAIANNSHVASQSLRLVPGVDMTASIINVVQSLLEVSKASTSKN